VESVADFIPDQALDQGTGRGLAVVAWGSTAGTVYQAVKDSIAEGFEVSQIHIRYLNPLPKNLGDLLAGFDKVLVPELNNGQLATLLRDKLLIDVEQLNQVSGQPLKVSDLKTVIQGLAKRQIQEVQHG
jgi:2-oxoglutarate ferredoxin oxidoreductase subunit alpha